MHTLLSPAPDSLARPLASTHSMWNYISSTLWRWAWLKLDQMDGEYFGKDQPEEGRGILPLKKKFSVEQIVGVLKQAEVGVPVAELIRKAESPSRPTTAGRPSTPGLKSIRCVRSGSFATRTRS
ncbi:MAG: hypothetical protein KGN79_13625 [Acidobacteriota bacterium]|nr:hypothetical protein [Acidobacteriota bacterium]